MDILDDGSSSSAAAQEEPAFVSLSAGEAGVGDMWWAYSSGHLMVYNSGTSGLQAYARIDYV